MPSDDEQRRHEVAAEAGEEGDHPLDGARSSGPATSPYTPSAMMTPMTISTRPAEVVLLAGERPLQLAGRLLAAGRLGARGVGVLAVARAA